MTDKPRTQQTDGPNYEVEIDADELLADLADEAAAYGERHAEYRRWWQESLEDGLSAGEFTSARYWMLEARGGLRALGEALVAIQPGGRFRNEDGTVAVREYMQWLSRAADSAHERSHGPYTRTRQANEAETAFTTAISTMRDDYGVGWPRIDDLGAVMECDLP